MYDVLFVRASPTWDHERLSIWKASGALNELQIEAAFKAHTRQ